MKKAKKALAILLALIMSLSSFSLVSFAEETELQEHLAEVPEGYVGIYTKDDLDSIKLDMAGKYILMNDIIFEDFDYEKGGSFYNSGKGWEPIGTSSTNFTGVFDGNRYKISHLYINNSEQDYIGLFGYVNNATIKNVSLDDVNITGEDYVGGIAGYSYQNSRISYCYIQGTVTGTEYVGGVVGYQYSGGGSTNVYYNYIQYCNNATFVSGINNIGGITGCSRSYRDSYYGRYGNSYVNYCSNSGDITAAKSRAGGIIGASSSYSDSSSFRSQDTNYCYNSGEVSALSYAGGIVGFCYSDFTEVRHCYSIGTVTATSNFGGCFGDTPKTSTFCYYLDEAVVNPTCTSGIAKSEDQLKKATTFEQWNFDSVWTIGGREDYPYPELVSVPLVLPEDYAHKHEYTSKITTSATHTTTGVMTFICDCGDSYTETIDKITDHSYESLVTAPTCTEQGYTTYTCECGDSYVDDYVSAVGHNFVGVVTAPTCTEQGYTIYTCKCSESYIRDYVSAIGHNYTSKITIPATHLTTGVETFTCPCGDTYTEIIAKTTEHTYNAVINEPTCTEQGYTTYTCECGDNYIDDYVDALSHTPANVVEENYVAPTCTENGSKDVVTYCSVCDEEINRETVVLNATGHNVGDDGNCNICDELICKHNCHKGGFFWKLTLFFNKLFRTNKYCSCGVAHY
ncbi:MAG: hypothetical protein IJB72_04790 [Clostridia bacterium]|nr:hypothetical protein [Clostridia bacterium]